VHLMTEVLKHRKKKPVVFHVGFDAKHKWIWNIILDGIIPWKDWVQNTNQKTKWRDFSKRITLPLTEIGPIELILKGVLTLRVTMSVPALTFSCPNIARNYEQLSWS